MSRLKLVNAVTMEKLLGQMGFAKKRQKGSHVFYRHLDGRTTTLPHHKAKVLARPLTRAILREINISIDQYNDLLKKL